MDAAQTDQELLEKEFNTSTLPIDEILRGDKELPIFLSDYKVAGYSCVQHCIYRIGNYVNAIILFHSVGNQTKRDRHAHFVRSR